MDAGQSGGNGGGDAQNPEDMAKNAGKKAAQLGKDAVKAARAAGGDVSAGASLLKKYGPYVILPAICGFMAMILIMMGLVVGFFSIFKQDKTTCSTGPSTVAVMASSGPINAGSKFPSPLPKQKGQIVTVTPARMNNAITIVQTGLNHQPPVPTNGIVIAIAAAWVESTMDNLNVGLNTSKGLFQQEFPWLNKKEQADLAATGVDARLNPTIAATKFYNKLLSVKGWQNMSPGDAAQATQHSGYPDKYQYYIPIASGMVMSILDGILKQNPSAQATLVGADGQVGQDCSGLDPNNAIPVAAETVAAGPMGSIQLATVPGIGKINAKIAAQVTQMIAAAAADGITLKGGSYRSFASQVKTRIANGCGGSNYMIYQAPSTACHPPTARPGTSQHELGLAIDFTKPGGGTISKGDPTWTWLKAHAAEYGLYNYPREAWHWSTTGK
jgi:hypothetical protein